MGDIPSGFYLQGGGGRQLVLAMIGHTAMLGRKKWKVPQMEGEELRVGWRQQSEGPSA